MKVTNIVLFVTEEGDKIHITEYPGKYTQELGITSRLTSQNHFLPPEEALRFIRRRIEEHGVKR